MSIYHQDWLNTGFEYKNHITGYEDNNKKHNSPNVKTDLDEYKILVKQDNSIDYQFEIIYNMVVLLDPIIEHTLEFISDIIS